MRVIGNVRASAAGRDAGQTDQMERLLRHGHRLFRHLLCHLYYFLLSIRKIHEKDVFGESEKGMRPR